MTDLAEFSRQFAANQRERARVERVLGQYDHLPHAGETPKFQPDGARIVVGSYEHLGAWLESVGGEVTATALPDGFEAWTLTARVEDWRGGPPVEVRVALVVVAGEWRLADWLQCVTPEAVA